MLLRVIAPSAFPFRHLAVLGIWFGNLLAALSAVLMLEGFARFLGQPAPRRVQTLSLVAVGLGWPLLLWFRPEDVTLRISILAFLGALWYARCAFMFLSDRGCRGLASRHHCLVVHRRRDLCSLAASSGLSPRAAFDPNPFVEIYLLLNLLSYLVTGMMTAILVGVRLRMELLARIEDERAQLLMLSHELRTPLAIVSRSSELLDEGKVSADPADARRVAQICSAASRMSVLVEQFLVRARHDDSHERTERFDLAQEIRSLAWSPRLVLDLPDQVAIAGDRKVIGIIFSNIVDNALKYSAPHSPVDVLLHANDGRIHLTVKDRGVGLGPEEDRMRLGEKFFAHPIQAEQRAWASGSTPSASLPLDMAGASRSSRAKAAEPLQQ